LTEPSKPRNYNNINNNINNNNINNNSNHNRNDGYKIMPEMANERGIHHSVSNNYSNKIDDIYADEFNQISCVNTHKDNNDKDDHYKGNDTAGGNHFSHDNNKNNPDVHNNSVD